MRRLISIVLSGIVSGHCGLSSAEQLQVVLGPSAEFALNQPFVDFSMSDGATTLGPSSANRRFLLDTAANSIVAVSRAASDLASSPGNFNTGTFAELGVGGTTDYFVSEPYRMNIVGNNGSIHVDNVKILSDPGQSFGQPELGFEPFVGIAGQPVMANRVTTMDIVPQTASANILDLSSLSSSKINVEFGNEVPAGDGHRYAIPMTALHFEPEGAVTPSASPLAMVDVTHRIGCEVSTGSYAFDTGAQMSIISMSKLAEMGLDASDATSSVTVQGAGGTRDVPVFQLEEFRIETNGGVDIVYREDDGSAGLNVIGLDLPKIDGVIGADILSQDGFDPNDLGSLLAIILGGGLDPPDNPIDTVHLDFRELHKADQSGTATMYFDLKPEFDNVTPSDRLHLADGNADGKVDDADLQIWQQYEGQTGTRCSTGDFNRDGRTDESDYDLWVSGKNGTGVGGDTCDFDGDGTCDVTDLDGLLDALGTNDATYNLDLSDPSVNLDDRDAWLTLAGNQEQGAPYLLADVNFDGTVDALDLNALGQRWNQDGNLGYAEGDIDGDNFVGPSDLNQLGRNWLKESSSAAPQNSAVPEPKTPYRFVPLLAVIFFRRTRGNPTRSSWG